MKSNSKARGITLPDLNIYQRNQELELGTEMEIDK